MQTGDQNGGGLGTRLGESSLGRRLTCTHMVMYHLYSVHPVNKENPNSGCWDSPCRTDGLVLGVCVCVLCVCVCAVCVWLCMCAVCVL